MGPHRRFAARALLVPRAIPAELHLRRRLVAFVVSEQHADHERDLVEWLGPDPLTSLGDEDLDVAVLRPAVDCQGLLVRIEGSRIQVCGT